MSNRRDINMDNKDNSMSMDDIRDQAGNQNEVEEGVVISDDYIAQLWQYDIENPQMGMRDKDELRKIFFNSEFDFNSGSYQAGELTYLAYYGGRLSNSIYAEMLQNDNDSKKAEAEEGIELEKTPQEQELQKQKEELFNVTQNRLAYIHRGIRDWIKNLDGIYYYKSRFTGYPYIDGKGRVFAFILDEAIDKARMVADESADFELAYTSNINKLSETLYLNAADKIIINDGILPFEAERRNIFPTSLAEASPEEDKTADLNRELRYFILSFHQAAQSPVRTEGNEEERKMSLLQLEAQISTRLLQISAYFTTNRMDASEISFVMAQDGQGRKAITCFVDKESKPEDDERFQYKSFSLFPIANSILASQGDPNNQVDGIVINPGTLNFYMDVNWLKRLVNFSAYLQEQNKDKE